MRPAKTKIWWAEKPLGAASFSNWSRVSGGNWSTGTAEIIKNMQDTTSINPATTNIATPAFRAGADASRGGM